MPKRGPRTAAGRAAVRFNAVTHGLLSAAPLIRGLEEQRDWDDLRNGLLESLAPVGRLEEALADLIVVQYWRIRRIPAAEAEAVAITLEVVDETDFVYGSDPPSELRERERRLARAHELLSALPSMPDNTSFSNEDVAFVLLAVTKEDPSLMPATVPGAEPPCDTDDVEEWDAGLLRDYIAAIAESVGGTAEEHTAWSLRDTSQRLVTARANLAVAERAISQRRRRSTLPDERTLNNLSRYEAHLYRRLFQAHHELEALQARRRGEPAPLTRLQVHGLPGA